MGADRVYANREIGNIHGYNFTGSRILEEIEPPVGFKFQAMTKPFIWIKKE